MKVHSSTSEPKSLMADRELSSRIKLYRPQGLNPVVDQREELPLLPFGYLIGYVPAASRGGTQ